MSITLEQIKDEIYSHITNENDMGLPPHESWEGITDDHDWVVESLENGYTLEDLQGKIFDEVYEKWSNENEVEEEEEEDE